MAPDDRVGQSFDVRRNSEKGTHLSVEGELRYREFNDKKHKKLKVRLAEIHLGKIGKLDRVEKRAGQDYPASEDSVTLKTQPSGALDEVASSADAWFRRPFPCVRLSHASLDLRRLSGAILFLPLFLLGAASDRFLRPAASRLLLFPFLPTNLL
jgi:hypothetical protein